MEAYRAHCSVSRAMEVLCTPDVLPLLRELMEGESGRAELQQRLPWLSEPAIVRLLDLLTQHGLVAATLVDGERRYRLTHRGLDTREIVDSFGRWGNRWLPVSLHVLHTRSLLNDICRDADRSLLPVQPALIQFDFVDAPPPRRWWLTLSRAHVEATDVQPSRRPLVFIRAARATLAQLWLGTTTWQQATLDREVAIAGENDAVNSIGYWIGTSRYASTQPPVPEPTLPRSRPRRPRA